MRKIDFYDTLVLAYLINLMRNLDVFLWLINRWSAFVSKGEAKQYKNNAGRGL